MTARMSRRRYRDEMVIDFDWLLAVNNVFSADSFSTIGSMHNAFTAKLRSKALVVGNIVDMRQQHRIDTAHFFYTFD